MRKIKWSVNAGFAGCTYEDKLEVDKETTDEEINETVFQAVLERIDWGWQEVKDVEPKLLKSQIRRLEAQHARL